MRWQLTTRAVVSRPSLLWKCTTTPASSFEEERRAQPCALTTSVSQTSENCECGSRLVTRIGMEAGTRELRRSEAEEDELCIDFALSRRLSDAEPRWARRLGAF